MTPRRAAALALLALALGACGPYADVAQKLDVTARVAGDTWIAAAGDRTELRILLVGKPDKDGVAQFAFSSLQQPISAGTSATALQGKWTEVGAAGAVTLRVEFVYTLPDERSVSLGSRRGASRTASQRMIPLTVTRTGGQLVVAGDASIAGTYVAFGEALTHLGAATDPAACAFQVANLGVRTSEIRIIGFGGPGMSQYNSTATFVGTVAGSFQVHVSVSLPSFASTTTIGYSGFEDLGGAQVDGAQVTSVGSGGDGDMAGILTFVLQPRLPDGTAAAPITGTINYGSGADAVQITNGIATGGFYVVALQGGGSARVSPVTAPSPSVAECLALP